MLIALDLIYRAKLPSGVDFYRTVIKTFNLRALAAGVRTPHAGPVPNILFADTARDLKLGTDGFVLRATFFGIF